MDEEVEEGRVGSVELEMPGGKVRKEGAGTGSGEGGVEGIEGGKQGLTE